MYETVCTGWRGSKKVESSLSEVMQKHQWDASEPKTQVVKAGAKRRKYKRQITESKLPP